MKLCAFLAFASMAVSCPAGEVLCGSAESMAGLMRAWTSGFTAAHPDTPARVAASGRFSADAFLLLLHGELQVAPFSRELFPSERARFVMAAGTEPVLVPVGLGSRDTKGGTHAIAIFVHEKNPLARLSLRQLREIFAQDGRITTWGQLGLGGEWAGRRIVLHGMVRRRDTGDPPGIVNFLELRLLEGRAWRKDCHEHPDIPGGPQGLELIVRSVAADEAAIGYSGFPYTVEGVKTLALAESDAGPSYAGTREDVARGDYPLTRKIYLCLSDKGNVATKAFVRYVLGPDGQRAIAADGAHFFPLPPAALATARAQLP